MVDKIAEKIDETDEYLKVLSQKMQKHYRSLKAQVSQLDRDLRQMLEERIFYQVRYTPTTYRPKSTRTTTPSTSKTKVKASCLSTSSLDSQDIPETPPPKIQKEEETPDKDTDNNSHQETSTHETPRSVSSKSESEDNYIPRLFMENIKEEELLFEKESPEETLIPERTKPNGGPWFTFDDIPPSRTMKEWYHNLGTLKQDELHRLETTANILGVLHREFIGDMEIFDRKNRQEFFEPDEVSSLESEDDRYLHVYSFKEIGSSLPTPPLPCVKVHILATKFSRPKKVIAYMDTRNQITMTNPSILPAESWVPHVAYFVAADGKVSKTDLMTKEKIGIKFFPYCIVWTRVVGSNLPNKDIVVGMDVYSATSRLQILPT
ncbi:hypothetical protein KIW84_020735 [Lathyrus oleraceus]|uniref:Uncharacterized protein n=1 Tax=Pisum sativum TaxID=3888 RepID=A0A9D4Y5U3_PEA|nr:hypothetical protein KIW84_020735 [Pisum sativum]